MRMTNERSYLDPQLLNNNIQGGNKEFITDDGEGDEHVHDPNNVDHDPALLSLLEREQVRGEELTGFICWGFAGPGHDVRGG